jgi:hypothetical protein
MPVMPVMPVVPVVPVIDSMRAVLETDRNTVF